MFYLLYSCDEKVIVRNIHNTRYCKTSIHVQEFFLRYIKWLQLKIQLKIFSKSQSLISNEIGPKKLKMRPFEHKQSPCEISSL